MPNLHSEGWVLQMIRKVAQALRKVPELSGAKVLIAAVSGGADSVAMLYCLYELRKVFGCRLVVVHLNHMTRGAESNSDAVFVQELCKRLKVDCFVKRVNVPALAVRKGISVEMAAREARYAFFIDTARKAGHAVIVTAHTRDDQAETMILKLVRGAGLRGLAGISGWSMLEDVPLLRPMLAVSRHEVIQFLTRKGVDWREDSSNDSDAYLRNRVRHKVLPLLETDLNPDVRSVLVRTAEVIRQDNELLDGLAVAVLAECRCDSAELDLVGLKQEHRAIISRVLILWLADAGIDPAYIDVGLINAVTKLIDGRKANAALKVSGGFQLIREYDRLLLKICSDDKSCTEAFRYMLNIPGKVEIESAGIVVESSVGDEVVRERGRPGDYPAHATVSRKAVGRKKIYVRSWKEGDRIRPMGMKGSRKLKDIFIDLKVPAELRRRVPVLECGGEIIWLPGYRVARGWEVGPAEKCVLLTVS